MPGIKILINACMAKKLISYTYIDNHRISCYDGMCMTIFENISKMLTNNFYKNSKGKLSKGSLTKFWFLTYIPMDSIYRPCVLPP